MTCTILIHLHVEAPEGDERDADEIADAVGGALSFVQTDDDIPEGVDELHGLTFAVPLAEEIEARA